MNTLVDVEATAMSLTEAQRAILASRLLESLPAMLYEEDEGYSEALRRDSELDADPSMGMSMDEFTSSFKR